MITLTLVYPGSYLSELWERGLIELTHHWFFTSPLGFANLFLVVYCLPWVRGFMRKLRENHEKCRYHQGKFMGLGHGLRKFIFDSFSKYDKNIQKYDNTQAANKFEGLLLIVALFSQALFNNSLVFHLPRNLRCATAAIIRGARPPQTSWLRRWPSPFVCVPGTSRSQRTAMPAEGDPALKRSNSCSKLSRNCWIPSNSSKFGASIILPWILWHKQL